MLGFFVLHWAGTDTDRCCRLTNRSMEMETGVNIAHNAMQLSNPHCRARKYSHTLVLNLVGKSKYELKRKPDGNYCK